MPYSAGRMLASKIAYYARNSAGRIYLSLILAIPSKPYSFHSVHSAIGSRMNGIIPFHSFRERNRSQNNTNTVYSESVPIPENVFVLCNNRTPNLNIWVKYEVTK